jgi:hypothetical protein
LGNEAGKLGKTLGKMGREVEKLGKMVGKLGTALRKMGTVAFALGNVARKLGIAVGELGTDVGAVGAVLCNWGHRPEICAATGSRRFWDEKFLRSGRDASARWLSVRLLIVTRSRMAYGGNISKNDGGRQEGFLIWCCEFETPVPDPFIRRAKLHPVCWQSSASCCRPASPAG